MPIGIIQSETADGLVDGRVPITIGVTGHRIIDSHDPDLCKAVARECAALRGKYPSTPFVILSPLAEGADRLVARIAMEAPLCASLIAILPTRRTDYETDFGSDESRAEFAELLSRAELVVELPFAGDGDWRTDETLRPPYYAKVGGVIAEYSQILFALWDGLPARGPGGTASVVEWFQRGYAPKDCSPNPSDVSPLDPPASGLLIWMKPGGETRRIPNLAQVESMLLQTEMFNSMVLEERALIAKAPDLAPSSDRSPLAAAVYKAADALSVKLAKRVRKTDQRLHLVAVVAFVLLNMLDNYPAAAVGFLSAATVMVVLVAIIRTLVVENRFLKYRALAEAMRVLFFWRMVDISRPVWLGRMSKHSGVTVWLHHTVRSVEFRQDALKQNLGDRTGPSADARWDIVREHWIDDQIRFFTRAKKRHSRQYATWTPISRGSLMLSYGLAVAVALGALTFGAHWLTWDGQTAAGYQLGDVARMLQLGVGVTAAVGLVARAYVFRQAGAELDRQYSEQLRIFELAREALKQPAPAGWTHTEILALLGAEVLQESGEWLWLRHSRPFEAPQ